jgi:hypothetical protein
VQQALPLLLRELRVAARNAHVEQKVLTYGPGCGRGMVNLQHWGL